MNKKNIFLIIFVIFCIIQLGLLSYMIIKIYINLDKGKTVRLECILRDPYDFMKGRYVTLNFSIEEIDSNLCPPYSEVNKYKTVFCLLEVKEGFHTVKKVVINKPAKKELFIKAKVNYFSSNNSKVFLNYDFNRYYLQEEFASLAEKMILIRENIKELKPALYLSVDEGGNGIAKRLTVKSDAGEMDIEEYIKQRLKK